mmetsp:Transcript_39899/g.91759  ORF Transcript_39899/g.91759 Transcript_39899/m.91759 type:complete len:254 (+) Transcript_39899:164-925(+)|eukprot:CAMPEP_0182574650 /NCGR_PEP_ID=MMETSP1324-20130603/26654_1 /TAXON_ID=236786 /ORGANISM="Florenciella sp., Strain RCC1587" /LENGTH=253 /DNA_ID=CAMNT_0024790093 /DNA_START=97 /DNA_END=858 /DNA_ORIENTATION=+
MGGGSGKEIPPVFIVDADKATEYSAEQGEPISAKKISLFCDKFAYVEQVDIKSGKEHAIGRDEPSDILVKSRDTSKKHASFQFDEELNQWTLSNYSQFNSLVSGEPCVDVSEGMGKFALAAIGVVRLGTAYVAWTTKPITGSIMVHCVDGFLAGRMWATSPDCLSFRIGRAEAADINIPNTMQTISSNHLNFENEPNVGWTVMDTSTFGTTLYGDWPLKKEKRVLCVPGLKMTIGRHKEKMTFVIKVHNTCKP